MIDQNNYQGATRRELHEMRAKVVIVGKRIAEIKQRIAAVDGQLDEAVALHQRMCEPIQKQLAGIESVSIEALIGRKVLDPSLEQQRKNLLQQLEDENTQLERARNDVDARLKPLREELAKATAELPNVNVVEGALLRSGDPAKVAKHEGLGLALSALTSAIAAYTKQRDEARHYLKKAQDEKHESAVQVWKRRLPKWEAALAALGSARAAMNTEQHELRETITNE